MVAIRSRLACVSWPSALSVMAASSLWAATRRPSLRSHCSVQPRIHALVVLVDLQELREELVVDPPVARVRLVGGSHLNEIRNVIECKVAQRDGGAEGRAANVRQAGGLG